MRWIALALLLLVGCAENACKVDSDCTLQRVNNCCSFEPVNVDNHEFVPKTCSEVCGEPVVLCKANRCVIE